MPTKEKTLADLFLETLKDVYYAEKQAVRMLGTAAKADELRQAFEQHREESRTQVERLEQVFELLDRPARGRSCEAIQGLNAEMAEILEDFGDSPAADAALISAAQAVEHYEIARYGTLSTWASQLGLAEAATLLEETLAEEKKTDELLTQLARSGANPQAEQTSSASEDAGEDEALEKPAAKTKPAAKAKKAKTGSAK
jgi:ferritin-like metal-binding protein YciE